MLRKLMRAYSMATFACHVKADLDEETRRAYRAACSKLSFYGEHEGKQYCVLHFPGEKKETAGRFEEAIKKKLKD
jgi:hypothetical protein